jgi:hypothetical protein
MSDPDEQPTTLFGVPLSAFAGVLLPTPLASDRLLAALPQLGVTLMVRGGKLDDVDPELLRELGRLVVAIAQGKPADRLFRQNENTKPRRENGFKIAFVYYYMRACSDDIDDDSVALAQVKAAKSLDPPKSDASVKKIAQRHRVKVLDLMQQKSPAELGEIMIHFTCSPEQLIALNLSVVGKGSAGEKRDAEQLLDHWKQRELTQEKMSRLLEYLKKKSPHIRD